jgi:hypothetical protein
MDALIALMATVMLIVLLPVSGQESSPTKRKDNRHQVGQLKSVPFSFDSQVTPVAKNMLEELKDVSITIATSGRPVLVAILPENSSKVNADPFAIVLTAKNTSTWTITILREDDFQVARRVLGDAFQSECDRYAQSWFTYVYRQNARRRRSLSNQGRQISSLRTVRRIKGESSDAHD